MRNALTRLLDRHPIITYTVARVALFLAVLVPLALIGLRGVTLLGLGILISGAISLFALDGVRARYSGRLSGYFSRLNQRIEDSARAEDEELDRLERQSGAPQGEAPAPEQHPAQAGQPGAGGWSPRADSEA